MQKDIKLNRVRAQKLFKANPVAFFLLTEIALTAEEEHGTVKRFKTHRFTTSETQHKALQYLQKLNCVEVINPDGMTDWILVRIKSKSIYTNLEITVPDKVLEGINEEFHFFFEDPEFIEWWDEYQKMRKHKKLLTTPRSNNLALKKVYTFSKKNIQYATEIVKRSAYRGYPGMYDLEEGEWAKIQGKKSQENAEIEHIEILGNE